MNRVVAGFLAGFMVSMVFAAETQADSVAYLDKGGVWVSSLNGKKKRKVSGKTKDRKVWTELAQADNGRIIAVRRQPGKVSNLNAFRLWGPTGERIYDGHLGYEPNWDSYAYPLELDLTADGRFAAYGYSVSRYGYPVGTLQRGTYVTYADRHLSQPFKIVGQERPTTVGSRLVTGWGSEQINFQSGGGKPPFANSFRPWLGVADIGLDLQRTDVAANRKTIAIELARWGPRGPTDGGVLMGRIKGLGGSMSAGCELPAKGVAEDVSLSRNGTSIAWHDRRGVVVSGAPTFGGSQTCKLKRRVKVISKTGKQPSIGNARVTVKKKKRGGRR